MRLYDIVVWSFVTVLVINSVIALGVFTESFSMTDNAWAREVNETVSSRVYSGAGTTDERTLFGDLKFGLALFEVAVKGWNVFPKLLTSYGFPRAITFMIELMLALAYAAAIVQLITKGWGVFK